MYSIFSKSSWIQKEFIADFIIVNLDDMYVFRIGLMKIVELSAVDIKLSLLDKRVGASIVFNDTTVLQNKNGLSFQQAVLFQLL